MKYLADISEFSAGKEYPLAFALLLRDMATGANIIWATDDYAHAGLPEFYGKTAQMRAEMLTSGRARRLICPRSLKPASVRKKRSRDVAEVFTPAWLCNLQNNLLDAAWFGRKRVFNKEKNGGKNWTALTRKICRSAFDARGRIAFPKGKTWRDYVSLVRMEAACGEAPYLVSRYDCTRTRKLPMPIHRRIGLLDRKLRVVSENADTRSEWIYWAKRAFESIYAFEFQGDNLLLARENLLFSFVDYFEAKFGERPSDALAAEIAEIIAWNVWQMDALKLVVPFSCHDVPEDASPRLAFNDSLPKRLPCPGCARGDVALHNGVRCRIKDWESGEILEFGKDVGS